MLSWPLLFDFDGAFLCTLGPVSENDPLNERWKWSRPNARVYTVLIQGLAASLRVSDALSVIKYICEVGVSTGEEVCLNNFRVYSVLSIFPWYDTALKFESLCTLVMDSALEY